MIIMGAVEITANKRENFATLPSTTCRALLRETTRPAHQALETKLNSVLANVSPSGYQTLLIGFYGFYRPMESMLTLLVSHPDFPPEFKLRSKTPLLADDLLAMGLPQDALCTLPSCRHLPELSSIAQAFGALYVLEGAALGGQVIAPALKVRLGITPQNGSAFFYGDGSRVSERWKAFLQILAGRPTNHAAITAQAALETFQAFYNWLFPDGSVQTV